MEEEGEGMVVVVVEEEEEQQGNRQILSAGGRHGRRGVVRGAWLPVVNWEVMKDW